MKLLKCKITIRTVSGVKEHVGLFKTTSDAVMEAIKIVGEICCVRVEVIR